MSCHPSNFVIFLLLSIGFLCQRSQSFAPPSKYTNHAVSIPVPSILFTSAGLTSRSLQLSMMDHSIDLAHHAISVVSSLPVATADVAQNVDLDGLGHDIFVFLATSVVVVPLCKALKLSPVLGFLAVGCLIGPFGMQVFSNSKADLELGDFGILFLLFNEGLSLSPDRIKELGKFTGLGAFQLLISIGLFFVGTFWGGPVIIKLVQEMGIPIDIKLLRPIVDNPVQSFCIAAAGALSSSAFVLPILKQKNWEDRPEGIAGLSILLLQDLAVAPLLVILPLLAGSGPSTSVELGILVTKATVGFGALLAAGSFVLRYVFEIVAATRSTETFVAAALLVAVGMGQAADYLGLSASTGAFAAGVLLAGNRYRAQIQADIKPFEGILLGVFFLTAGANLDPTLVINEWLTLFIGILAFIIVKASIIFASGPALGLTKGQAARVALTLAGGGEFALILFKLAQDLGVLPAAIARLLEASVIISMSLTPLLGNLGSIAGNLIDGTTNEMKEDGLTVAEEAKLFDQIDTDDSGSIELDELRKALLKLNFSYVSIAEVFSKFDSNNDGFIDRDEWGTGVEAGFLSDACVVDRQVGQTSARVNIAEDALMILGYGEVGKSIYDMLSVSERINKEKGAIVCFDLNPSRVTAGVLSGAPVIFGDGGKIELLKAAGVTRPRAVIITFATDSRRIDATMQLRSCLPDDTPIYVYEGNSRIGQELLDAGATEVINETTETILRFATLLGVCQSIEETSQLRRLSFRNTGLVDDVKSEVMVHGLSEEYLTDLAEQIGVSRRQIDEQWYFFNSVAGNRDSVSIPELKELALQTESNGPGDATMLELFLEKEDEDGQGELTFVEYVRAYWKDTSRFIDP